jgi:hypothetical protein
VPLKKGRDESFGTLGNRRGFAPLAMRGGCLTATPLIAPSGAQGFSPDCSAMNDIGQCCTPVWTVCIDHFQAVACQSRLDGQGFVQVHQGERART